MFDQKQMVVGQVKYSPPDNCFLVPRQLHQRLNQWIKHSPHFCQTKASTDTLSLYFRTRCLYLVSLVYATSHFTGHIEYEKDSQDFKCLFF